MMITERCDMGKRDNVRERERVKEHIKKKKMRDWLYVSRCVFSLALVHHSLLNVLL